MNPRREQFQGCLIGLCLGDALGFPIEGFPPLICRRYARKILANGHAGKWTRYPYPFGQYSDDSQLTRELMLSLIQQQKFNPEDYACRIASLFKRKKILGFGKATESAARQLIQGIPWTHSGVLPPSAGNGSAVRATPLGLFFYDASKKLLQAAHEQSRITHQDPRCSAGAVVVAGSVALLLQTEKLDVNNFIDQLSCWAGAYSDIFAEHISNLKLWLPLPAEEASVLIAEAGADEAFESVWQGISPFVVSSILWSLYAFLKSPEDFWQVICTAITVGGDVDTMAAIAGAMSGTYLGIEAIPHKLAHKLTDQDKWKYPQLIDLANQCFDVKMALL